MRIRQKNVCDECRARKLGCDGALPTCTQCRLRGRACAGYSQDFHFISNHKQKAQYKSRGYLTKSRIRQRNRLPIDSLIINSEISPPRDLDLKSLEEMISFIARHYVGEELPVTESANNDSSQSRICGCWVRVLPAIVASRGENDIVISSAIKVLSLSIANRYSRDKGLNADFTEAYCAALALIREGLPTSNTSLYAGFVAASMCLTLAEVLFPTNTHGWRKHVQGIGDLMQVTGPSLHSTGDIFELFVGFRPLIVIDAFISRKATFIAQEEWIKIPFSINSASPMQKLLSHAALIPSLLEQADTSMQYACSETENTAKEICIKLTESLSALFQWEKSITSKATEPLYWPKSHISSAPNSAPAASFWFLDISSANAITHLWAFQAICLMELERLRSRISALDFNALVTEIELRSDIFVRSYIFSLATKICQSIEYSMQDEMRLYGPASAFFPLRIAREIFGLNPVRNQREILWCQDFFDQLRKKGINAIP